MKILSFMLCVLWCFEWFMRRYGKPDYDWFTKLYILVEQTVAVGGCFALVWFVKFLFEKIGGSL